MWAYFRKFLLICVQLVITFLKYQSMGARFFSILSLRRTLIIFVSSFVLYSCSTDEDISPGVIPESKEVRFFSSINETPRVGTRMMNSAWDSGDNIGIYMKENGKELSNTTILSEADNIEYITRRGDGVFTAADETQTIFFPEDGNKVDFIAYYPYQANVSNFKYPIDVSDQSSQSAIDLLYSNNSVGLSTESQQANLNFNHMLSKINFNFTEGEGVTDLSGLKVTIKSMPTLATFDLAKGTMDVDLTSVKNIEVKMSNEGKIGEAVLIPIGTKSIEVTFSSEGNAYTHTFSNLELKSGVKHSYNITIKDSGTSVVPEPEYAMWTETPLFKAQANLQYNNYSMNGTTSTTGYVSGERNFSMLYDKDNRVALWVAYPLHKSHIGDVSRTNAWAYDPTIEQMFQPNLTKSWPGSGYDRGHQIPSGDRTNTKTANRMTFYYSNMAHQQSQFNQLMWADLENKIRSWCGYGTDTVFMVTGVILSTQEDPIIKYTKDNSSRDCASPQYFYKAMAKKSGSTFQTIGFRIPNERPSDRDYDKHRITVAELEQETGFTFFPSIDDAAKKEIGSIFN